MKNGIKTTEFWIALCVVVMGALGSVYAETDGGRVLGLVASALASAGYGMSRSVVKAASSDDE